MNKHVLWMLIGCILPFLLIFLAPAIGLGKDLALFVFILAMFACHFFMIGHHRDDSTEHHQ